MKRTFFVSLCLALSATAATAQVNVNVNIGAPPPVIVAAPPTMLFLPEPAVYVAVGVPYDIYFISGRYYYMRGDRWYWGPGYDGPWVYVVDSSLPPGLRKFKVKQLHSFREREYVVYKTQGPGFKGKQFKAVGGPENKGGKGNQNSQGNGNGNGKGRGRG